MTPSDLMMIQVAIEALEKHMEEQGPDDMIRRTCSALKQIQYEQRTINETVRRLEHGVQHRNDWHRA